MPRRRLTIAATMLVVLFVGMAIALVRGELENRRLRAQLLRPQYVTWESLEVVDVGDEAPMEILTIRPSATPSPSPSPGR